MVEQLQGLIQRPDAAPDNRVLLDDELLPQAPAVPVQPTPNSHGRVLPEQAAAPAAAGPESFRADESAADSYPDLCAFLTSSPVRTAAETRIRYDAEAEEQQRCFVRELTLANLCLMATGVLSGIVLVAAPWAQANGATWSRSLQLTFGAATLALGALAAMLTYKARDADRLHRWLNARSKAELARITIFKILAEKAAAAGRATAMQGLAYVEAKLLDPQRRWLAERACQHRRSSDVTTGWGGISTGLAFLGGSGAIIASFSPDQVWLAMAGVIGAALAAYVVNREALRRDRPNADRYEKTATALDALAARHDEIAAEIAAGRLEALVAYATAVTDQLATEHQQWLEGTAQAQSVLTKLDGQLEQIRGGAKT
jgi:hypothetical protein